MLEAPFTWDDNFLYQKKKWLQITKKNIILKSYALVCLCLRHLFNTE